MPRPRRHADAAAKQAAYRRRTQRLAAETARLIALQDDYAHLHVAGGRHVPWLTPQATAEQRTAQAAAKERDMLDALWILQTLIADFGYDEVYTHVLQHLKPDAQ
jgi:hypothetical protein